MTNEQLFEGFKQFVEATVSQHIAQLATRIGGVEQQLERRISIRNEKVTRPVEASSSAVQDLETRLSRLEQVTIQSVDDWDRLLSEAGNTVTFTIDPSDPNASNLYAILEKYAIYVRCADIVKRGLGAAGQPAATASNGESQAAREWARENGYDVSSRGRLSASILEAFKAAKAETNSKPRKRRAKASASSA